MAPPPSRSALIAYHELYPHRSELPGWAVAAQRSATALAGVLPVVLMSNSRLLLEASVARPFHRAVRIDLLALSGLQFGGQLRALCGLKIWALLHGWSHGVLGAHVLLLDVDVLVLRPAALLGIFDPLVAYDLAGAMEGFSRGWAGGNTSSRDDSLAAPPDPAGRGWEVNTGLLAVRRNAAWLVEAWAAEFKQRPGLYSRLTGADQSALMLVLARAPRGAPPSARASLSVCLSVCLSWAPTPLRARRTTSPRRLPTRHRCPSTASQRACSRCRPRSTFAPPRCGRQSSARPSPSTRAARCAA